MRKIVLIWILLFAGISPALALFSGLPRTAPLRLSLSAPLYQSLAYRTRPVTAFGTIRLGLRDYDFTRRSFLSYDSEWNPGDPNGFTAFGGRPSVYFDADGRCVQSLRASGGFQIFQQGVWGAEEGFDTFVNATLGAVLTPPGMQGPQLDPIQNITGWLTGHDAYEPSDLGDFMKSTASQLAPATQDLLLSLGGNAPDATIRQEIAEGSVTQFEFDFVNNLSQKPAINWPANWGFAGDPAPATMVPGALVDRFGYPGGTFVSPEGTPFIQRSLAPGTQYSPYNVYQVLKPIDVNAGPIAPAFGMPGNGMQFQLPSSVQSLIDSGHLGVH